MSIPAVFVIRRSDGRRLHTVTSSSKFFSFYRGEGEKRMSNMDCAKQLAGDWARNGVICDIVEGVDDALPVGYSIKPGFLSFY